MEYLTTGQVFDAVRSIENINVGWKAQIQLGAFVTITTWKEDGRCVVLQKVEAETWTVVTHRPIYRDTLVTGTLIRAFLDEQGHRPLQWQQIKRLKPCYPREVAK